MVDDKSMGYALGATDYLTKPVDRDRLVTVLNRFRGRRAAGPVLIIEDDPATREIIRRALQAEGWPVHEAENGRDGLAQMAQAKPAAVLLDLMMPEMDGFGFLDEMRKQLAWSDVPVIVLTAKDLTSDDRLRLQGRIEKVLRKGVYRREELLKEVRRLVAACARRPSEPGLRPVRNQMEVAHAADSDR
jgi:CheY-like chemotaxis protein